MGFYDTCRAFALSIATIFTLPFLGDNDSRQAILSFGHIGAVKEYPKFPAPSGPDSDADFVCKYPALGEAWKSCSTSANRQCWLKGPNGRTYDINTDYEKFWPEGITREYHLEVDEMPINGDGVLNPEGKVFNQTYPGPWIQACWGDIIKVTVKNKLKYNGTTIHWHGLRQLGTMEMDGVNGVTQCPIAPDDSFTYTFRAVQYGTSWYHSHYSLQYADGLVGPITIYGPSSSNYDEGRNPILITDWSHRSAFQDWQRELVPLPSFPTMNSVLLNGVGNFAGSFPHERFNMTVKKGKKYILRVINTSVDTTWIFSVDNHNFTVMTTDFVPIKPYDVTHIVIGIGQRYHIVLNANPIDTPQNPASPEGNYWIRTVPADGCKGFEIGNEPDERQGILRYNATSTGVPTTFRENYSLACRDENYTRLEPVHLWNVDEVKLAGAEKFDIGKDSRKDRPALSDNFTWWSFGANPLWLNFSDPTILNLDNKTWNKDYVVVPEHNKDGWVYLAITAPASPQAGLPGRSFFPVAHPLHLHGHDFALLAQGTNATELPKAKLKFNNPPRRDVALIPAGGYLVVAFKADNPGSWLFHCHIAWHASSGLALQILERQEDLKKLMTKEKLAETRRVCANWDKWFANKTNLWSASGPFQDDSGI
ncbi:Laccase 2 [Pleurostoma richardsiae]|uniref:Laccase 2 n=1 Tax=Pleurostoma richardsiae TaxID=41990 RepID=A0AA38VJX5_9PEZI|nr:Laccase 2 [Pleurostoma richardsiae]